MHLETPGLGGKDLPCSQSFMATSTTMQGREKEKGMLLACLLCHLLLLLYQAKVHLYIVFLIGAHQRPKTIVSVPCTQVTESQNVWSMIPFVKSFSAHVL